jgi:cell division protein FtsZ
MNTKNFLYTVSIEREINNYNTEERMRREKETDCAIMIPNPKLLQIVEDRIYKKTEKNEFELVDNILYKVINEIVNMLTIKKEEDINIDFNDLKLILSHKELTFIGISKYKGKSAAYHALKKAIRSPLLDDLPIERAKGVLINFSMTDNYPLYELEKSMNLIYESVDPDADIIFGTSTFEEMAEDEVKVVIIATGLEEVRVI